MSEKIWSLKEKGVEYKLEWRFVDQIEGYNLRTGRCKLCLEEKYLIIYRPEVATLNQRSELASVFPHSTKFLLSKC